MFLDQIVTSLEIDQFRLELLQVRPLVSLVLIVRIGVRIVLKIPGFRQP